MVKGPLLLFIAVLVAHTSNARMEYHSSFINRNLEQIRQPLLHITSSGNRELAELHEAVVADDPRHRRHHNTSVQYIPQSPQEVYRRLFVSGTIITAVGASGTILGAATLQNDSRDNPVSLGLMIVSVIITIIGAGLLTAGFYIKAHYKSSNTRSIEL